MLRRGDNTDQKHASNMIESKILHHLLLKRLSDRDAKVVFVDTSCTEFVHWRNKEFGFISPQYRIFCFTVPALYGVVCGWDRTSTL
jgi:hypothetical protein